MGSSNRDEGKTIKFKIECTLATSWYSLNTLIQIVIDVHSGPESQNPFDNGGRRRDVNSDIHWCCDGSGSRHNIERSIAVVDKISSMLKTWLDNGAITWESLYGICVLNEPFAIPGKRDDIWITLRDDFYPKANDAIRKHLDDRVFVNYQSAFRAISDFNDHFNNLSSVSIDQHLYQCFWDWCKVAATLGSHTPKKGNVLGTTKQN